LRHLDRKDAVSERNVEILFSNELHGRTDSRIDSVEYSIWILHLHYLVDPKGVFPPISLGTKTTPIANFMYPAANVLYVLTTDGNLYHIDTTDPLTWNKIGSTSNTYKENAFAFAVDEGTSKYHFITKPTLKSAPLVVFTIPYTTSSSATQTQIQSGYAKELSLTNIVSAMDISTVAGTSRLLVATYENGMFEITINNANADVDDASNGSTTGAEEYTFL
ncbi:MAG: hypothetical protein PHR69_09975, partial [Sphaerochaeta sp.]|nr:hypothetical protein [Sphaerochaeta sp.]